MNIWCFTIHVIAPNFLRKMLWLSLQFQYFSALNNSHLSKTADLSIKALLREKSGCRCNFEDTVNLIIFLLQWSMLIYFKLNVCNTPILSLLLLKFVIRKLWSLRLIMWHRLLEIMLSKVNAYYFLANISHSPRTQIMAYSVSIINAFNHGIWHVNPYLCMDPKLHINHTVNH